MARMLHILGGCAIIAACSVFALCADQWKRGDPELDELRDRPGVVEAFKEQQAGHNTEDGEQMSSPLLAQAEAFAAYTFAECGMNERLGGKEACGTRTGDDPGVGI